MGIVKRRRVHAEPDLVVDVLRDVVSFVKVLFFFVHEFLEDVVLFFGGRIKIEVVHDEIACEIDVVGQFEQSDGSLMLGRLNTELFLMTEPVGITVIFF